MHKRKILIFTVLITVLFFFLAFLNMLALEAYPIYCDYNQTPLEIRNATMFHSLLVIMFISFGISSIIIGIGMLYESDKHHRLETKN